MASLAQELENDRSGTPGKAASRSRNRIIAAAAELLRIEPHNFSVQRAARHAGISARAVYTHFESGAELAHLARLSTLQSITDRLPDEISFDVEPEVALQQFAISVANAIRLQGAASLLLSRQDAEFCVHYRELLRRPLIAKVEAFLAKHRLNGRLAHVENSKLAELFVTVIESIGLNYDPEVALDLHWEEALRRSVQVLCSAYGV